MNKKTLRALQGSITKWQKIVDGTGVDAGTNNCPLCQLFNENHCKGCPVAEAADDIWCFGTPYYNFDAVSSDLISPSGEVVSIAKTEQAKRAAEKMLNFLIDLLPKDTPR